MADPDHEAPPLETEGVDRAVMGGDQVSRRPQERAAIRR